MRIALVITLLSLASPALAQLCLLPPEEFDHYDGPVAYQLARDQDHVRELCRMTFSLGVALACAFRYPNGTCLIIKVSDDEIRAAGHDPDIVLRHERGHCAGWGADHRGAR
jgi:hypothetical protein